MQVIKINNKKYTTSFIDTIDTIKNLVANDENTLPNMIKLPDLKFDKKINNIAENLTQILETDTLLPPDNIVKLAQDWDIKVSNVILEWLYLHPQALNNYAIELLERLKTLNPTEFWSYQATVSLLESYKKRRKERQTELIKILEKEKKFREQAKAYSPIDTTSFIQDSVIIEYSITLQADPFTLFDNIQLTGKIPFVKMYYNDNLYYKVLENLKPEQGWIEKQPNEPTLSFKIRNIQSFGTATIQYQPSVTNYQILLTIESLLNEKDNDAESLKEMILNTFQKLPRTIDNVTEKGIKGVFAIPDFDLKRDVLLELITNNPLVSYFFYIDEVREISSKKSVLYIYYSPNTEESTNVIAGFLSHKSVTRNDPFYIKRELPLFTPYLNVRISRALNLEQVEHFKRAVALILDIYLKNFDTIVADYNKVIPGFKNLNKMQILIEEPDKQLKQLQQQDPDLFIYGYPSKCEKKKQPTAINKSEVKNYEEKGYQVMNYPKDSENYFYCDSPDFPYPGLVENKFQNNDMYEYLPCCYAVNQKVGNKNLNRYLKDIKKGDHLSTNIVSKKALKFGRWGYLPKNLQKILGPDFYRVGVDFGPNSFISAVLLSVDETYSNIQDRIEYVNDIRMNLASENFASIVQNVWKLDKEQIINNILDFSIPFDSKKFIGLLEAFYNCQIIVFTRNENALNGDFEYPYYSQGYLYKGLEKNMKTVLIYKHYGIKSDSLEQPHYELITRKASTFYLLNDDIINTIYSYFLKSYKLYQIGLGRYHTMTEKVVELSKQAKSQIIDTYGKLRGLIFENKIYILFSPMTPFDNINMVRKIPQELPNYNSVKKFVQYFKLKIHAQNIIDSKTTTGFLLSMENVKYAFIPFSASKIVDNIQTQTNLTYNIDYNQDILQKTATNKKIADFLMQLVLYSFSLYYSNIKLPKNDNKELARYNQREMEILNNIAEEFIRDNLVVDEEYYKTKFDISTISRQLSTNSNFFEKEQLIVDSQRSLERLRYYLLFMLSKDPELVKMYKNKEFLDNYYVYRQDFTQMDNQIVFVGLPSITNWLESQQENVYNSNLILNYKSEKPYFYSHWSFSNNSPVMIQNVKKGRLERAISVVKTWLEKGINTGYYTPIVKQDMDMSKVSIYYFYNGRLYKKGNGIIRLFEYYKNHYAAILNV